MKLAILDWKGTLFASEADELIEGAEELVKYLHDKGVELVLIGKDQGGDMYQKLEESGLGKFFRSIDFISNDKSSDLFKKRSVGATREEIWVVGDRIKSEVKVGNEMGAKTLWIKRGKFADETPQSPEEEPNVTVANLREALEIFKQQLSTE